MKLPKGVLVSDGATIDSELVRYVNSFLVGRKLSKRSKERFSEKRIIEGVEYPSLEKLWEDNTQNRNILIYLDRLKIAKFFHKNLPPEQLVGRLMKYNGEPINVVFREDNEENKPVTLK